MKCIPYQGGIYDKILCYTSVWMLYAAAHQKSDTFELQCVQLLTIALGIASFAHWRWYNNPFFLFIDACLVVAVCLYHILAMPNTSMLCCAVISILCFIIVTILNHRNCFIKNGFKFRYLFLHNAFRFFGFWMVMLAHDNNWSLLTSITMWSHALLIALTNRRRVIYEAK